MTTPRNIRLGLALLLVVLTVTAGAMVRWPDGPTHRTTVVAYFDNSNGVFAGDEVRILGVAVGEIAAIEPQPHRAKITLWVDDEYKIPADAKAVILAPQLVTARSIELTPAYTGGPVMADGAVIDQARTAVPVEWDDLRQQLEKLTDALQPTQDGGVSTLGAFINTSADNLRGQGGNIREAIVKLSQAFSVLGDHSGDIFGTVKNLSLLVSALHDSSDLMKALNGNLASATRLLVNDPGEVGEAVRSINTAVEDVTGFLAENREALGVTADKLSSISTAVNDSIGDVKQALHIAPNTLQNLVNIYQPAQAGLTGALVVSNFANPVSFVCGAIQAASRLGAEQSAKLCVQYLAPIIKNRQFNFPPIGENLFVGTQARPNEITYSEDWLRPDHRPTPPPDEAAVVTPGEPTDPAQGLSGLMVHAGGGS